MKNRIPNSSRDSPGNVRPKADYYERKAQAAENNTAISSDGHASRA